MSFNFILMLFFAAVHPFSKADSATAEQGNQTAAINGAWQLVSTGTGTPTDTITIKLVVDGFFTVASYDQANKRFYHTYGGTYNISNDNYTEHYEFSTIDSSKVGQSTTLTHKFDDGKWHLSGSSSKEVWVKIDEANDKSPLSGAWRIAGREDQEGNMNMRKPGPRKTVKVLTNNRFQWIAYNTATKQLSGTGGGTYTTQNGKYAETIEFFSRDSSRVGVTLPFNYEVKESKWHHSGLSSKGNKVNEVWEKVAK